jgi:DNA-directed RNA polymerase specialized sigma24 family protein
MSGRPQEIRVAVQDAIVRRFIEGQSAAEIADALGLSVLEVRSALNAVYAELQPRTRRQDEALRP